MFYHVYYQVRAWYPIRFCASNITVQPRKISQVCRRVDSKLQLDCSTESEMGI